MKYQKKSQITIVIPVHGKQEYIERCLLHYSKTMPNLGIDVIFFDSSDQPYEISVAPFKYLYFGPENNREKFFLILEYINTEYMVIAASDDLLLSTAIIECVDFLNKNADYSAAHGYHLEIDEKTGTIINPAYTKRPFLNHKNGIEYPKDAADRLREYFQLPNFQMLNHAVLRKEAWALAIERYKNIELKKLSAYAYSDFTQGVAILAHGNVRFINQVYNIRSSERILYTARLQPSLHQSKTFNDNYFQDVLTTTDPLSKMLAKQLGISNQNASLIHGFLVGQYAKSRVAPKDFLSKLANFYKIRKVKLEKPSIENELEYRSCLNFIRDQKKQKRALSVKIRRFFLNWYHKIVLNFHLAI